MCVTEAFRAERGPELAIALWSELKALRQNADDCVGNTAQADGFADNIFSSAVALLPCGVAEDYCLGSLQLVFLVMEVTSEDGSHPQRAEESAAHLHGRHGFTAGVRTQQIAVLVVSIERREDPVELFPIEEVGVGEIAARPDSATLGDIDQASGI